MRLLLASTSPRRARLLQEAGWTLDVVDPGVDDRAESAVADQAGARGLGAAEAVLRIALVKLLAALPRAAAGQVVVAADTTVALEGAMLGKAVDEAEARRMLVSLRGRGHEALTGLAIVDRDGRLRTEVVRSVVRFHAFPDAPLEAYLASGAWRGKAGAYGLQDPGAAPLIEGVEGSRSNVVGLPLEAVSAILGSP